MSLLTSIFKHQTLKVKKEIVMYVYKHTIAVRYKNSSNGHYIMLSNVTLRNVPLLCIALNKTLIVTFFCRFRRTLPCS